LIFNLNIHLKFINCDL